jgi:hypothetical protein
MENMQNYHKNNMQNIDFIGDVHGFADELESLLAKLGYHFQYNYWYHPFRTAVFVGDFINRGPQSRRTIKIIREMVEKGSALAILGNHELNAILYFTKRNNGLPLRLPGPSNKKLLDTIKAEYKDEKDLLHDIKWLRKLPLYYDFGIVRVVHAYWSQSHIELLHGALHEGKLKRSFLKEVYKGGTALSKAFMQTIKGIEYCFPPNMIVNDTTSLRRMYFRVKWWKKPNNATYDEISFETKFSLPNTTVSDNIIKDFEIYDSNEPPVFIGHYCVGLEGMMPAPNIFGYFGDIDPSFGDTDPL